MRTGRFLIVAACLVSLTGAAALLYGAAKDADPSRAQLQQQLQELLKERAKTAQLSVESTQAAYEAETVTLDQLLAALENRKEAKLAIAASQAAIIETLQENVDGLENIAKKIKQLYDIGAKGGEVNQWAQVKFAHETAQIELLRAQLSAKTD
jgi:hypothetical protein